MLIPIELNNQHSLLAAKVCDKIRDWKLTLELQSLEAACS